MTDLPTGKIDVDSDFGKEIGFTSEGFDHRSYMWGDAGGILWLSLVISKTEHSGAFRNLMNKIEEKGLTFRIPTPFGRMVLIGFRQGWKYVEEYEVDYFTNGGV